MIRRSANSSQVAQDFISIINDTAIDEGEPPTAEDDMTASQATAMIEEVLASGGESTGESSGMGGWLLLMTLVRHGRRHGAKLGYHGRFIGKN